MSNLVDASTALQTTLATFQMVFIREGLITKRLDNLETQLSETICLELTVSNKKWFILFAYRPPQANNT